MNDIHELWRHGANLFMVSQVDEKLCIHVQKGKKTWIKNVQMKNARYCWNCSWLRQPDQAWTTFEMIMAILQEFYYFVVWLNFIDYTKALLIPLANCLYIRDQWCQCMVLVNEDNLGHTTHDWVLKGWNEPCVVTGTFRGGEIGCLSNTIETFNRTQFEFYHVEVMRQCLETLVNILEHWPFL